MAARTDEQSHQSIDPAFRTEGLEKELIARCLPAADLTTDVHLISEPMRAP